MKLKIKKFDSVRSTNDEAIKLIKKNFTKPTLVFANRQTKGKGTRGKKWISNKGNVFISIYYEIKSKKIKFDEISILNPRIVKKAINKYSRDDIKIKWPNDLLIKNKKFCGILQEVIENKNKKYLIIGIGINTFITPKNKNFKSTNLAHYSKYMFKNSLIIKEIKKAYEEFISGIYKYNTSYIKKNYLKG
jgi:BirA family transcriptional regulator, biotin operon repressor / biotin---[acetyl-CoA-carboxylase] ligase